jgi:cyanophycinase-like exopeptidase
LLITIMGSGEIAPTMVPVHRRVFESLGASPVIAVVDSAYGFQENADELSEKAATYFTTSFPGVTVEIASFRSADAPAGVRERALETIRSADVVFAGPGSPTYALRTWEDTEVPDLLVEAARTGALTVASAASITVGSHALPVYEIYKVGESPRWNEGLDVLGALGLRVAVVPHFDNAEGGTHDTRFCWMGASRFESLRRMLPPDVVILGVDEHTAAVLDVETGVLEAHGRGAVTVLGETETVIAAGETESLTLLGAPANTAGDQAGHLAAGGDVVAEITGAFDEALGRGDVEPALDAILELEDTHEGWDDAANAHRAIRRMVTRLGSELSRHAARDARRETVVEALLDVRDRARSDGRWHDADAVRDAVSMLGFELRDTPDGTVAEPVD